MPETVDRYLFSIEGVSHALRVVRFSGTEALSDLFRLELTFATEGGAVDVDDVLGRPAVLTMLGEDGDDRFVHGIVSRFEEGDAGKKLTYYHVTIVPRVWRLQHRHDCRIFQELTAPQIIQKVLEGDGLQVRTDFRLALQGAYRRREYCVQYRESDWAFVERLMEEEGIAFFFEHAEGGHVLVLADRPAAHAPIAGRSTVPFRPHTGALDVGEHVRAFHFSGEVRPGKVTLRDYDFKKPALQLEGQARAAIERDADLEIYDYPGVYDAPKDAHDIAGLRLEERQASRQVGEGESACARLVPGFTFKLADHRREPLNRGYLITRVDFQGFEPSMGETHANEPRYENRFQCIPDHVPFRPPRSTPKPVMRGVQTAIVVGPPGEEIHTDAFGRVKVQFHWDRLGKRDDKSSCWIRVSQVWAGEAWGAMHIPRVNQEVIVDFLEGDPDRPIIVGRVYHGTNVPPYGLPASKTASTIKSNSTPGGGGSNELRFEDRKGGEEVYLHAQKDMNVVVENDASRLVGHDDALHVKHDRREAVDHDLSRAVGHDETEDIGHDRSISVGHDHAEEIAGAMSLTVGKSKTEDVVGDSTVAVGKNLAISVGAGLSIEVTTNAAARTGGSSAEEVGLDKTIKVGSKLVIACGAATVTVDKSGKITIAGTQIEVASSGPLKLSSAELAVSSSGQVKIDASGPVQLKGSGPMNIDASGTVKVKGARVGIN